MWPSGPARSSGEYARSESPVPVRKKPSYFYNVCYRMLPKTVNVLEYVTLGQLKASSGASVKLLRNWPMLRMGIAIWALADKVNCAPSWECDGAVSHRVRSDHSTR